MRRNVTDARRGLFSSVAIVVFLFIELRLAKKTKKNLLKMYCITQIERECIGFFCALQRKRRIEVIL